MTAAVANAPAADASAVAQTPETNGAAEAPASKPAKKTPAKKPDAKKPEKKGDMTPLQAMRAAVNSDQPQEAATTFFLNLAQIAENDNPRHEPSNLYEEGYILVGEHPTWKPAEAKEGETPEVRISLIQMALSEDIEVVRKFIALINEFEANRGDHDQSIVELAADLRRWTGDNKNGHGQFVPAFVKHERNKWCLIDGARRSTAILYNHAVDRVLKFDGTEGAPTQPYPPVLLCMDATGIKHDQFFALSMLLNLSRKPMTALQEGKVYYEMQQQINPDTGRRYTTKELHNKHGDTLGITYSTMRNRIALWEPHKPAVKDERTGEIKSKARGLTDTERQKVAKGEMSPTFASRKSLGERTQQDRTPPTSQANKRRAKTLKEMEAKFDSLSDDQEAEKKLLAWCMNCNYPVAKKESDSRIKAAEEKELRANGAA